MAGTLQISTKLSGPWQNDNYCSPRPEKKSWLENNIISAVRWKFDQYTKTKKKGARFVRALGCCCNGCRLIWSSVLSKCSQAESREKAKVGVGGEQKSGSGVLEPQRLYFYQGLPERETPGHKQQQRLTSGGGLRLCTLIVSHTYGPCHTNATPAPNAACYI